MYIIVEMLIEVSFTKHHWYGASLRNCQLFQIIHQYGLALDVFKLQAFGAHDLRCITP